MAYATVTDISNELNGLTIDGSSIPSSDTVNEWITQESKELDSITGQIWGSATITDEYHDYDGSGYILLDNAPVLSISSASYEKNGINATAESWVVLSEGRTSNNDFIVYKDEGQLKFHGTNKPVSGYQNFKITYTYGYNTVSPIVTKIISKKVALRVIDAVLNAQSSEEGGSIKVDVIELQDPSVFSINRVRELKNDINELTGKLGKFKTYRYNRRWN